MKHKVYIMDTNLFLCLVESKKHGTVGNKEKWDKKELDKYINEIKENKGEIAIPLPMIIESGNIIGHDKESFAANNLIEIINQLFEGNIPFQRFDRQEIFWNDSTLKNALNKWKEYNFIENGIGFGDLLVLLLRDYYVYKLDFDVTILSADKGLLSYEEANIFKFEKPKGSRRELR